MTESHYCTFTSHFLIWRFEPATSRSKTTPGVRFHFEHTKAGPYLFYVEIIKSLSLLSDVYHRCSYYCHNGLQLEAENSLLLQFYYISDSSNFISVPVYLFYESVRECVWGIGWQITLLSLIFVFDTQLYYQSISLHLLNNFQFCPL